MRDAAGADAAGVLRSRRQRGTRRFRTWVPRSIPLQVRADRSGEGGARRALSAVRAGGRGVSGRQRHVCRHPVAARLVRGGHIDGDNLSLDKGYRHGLDEVRHGRQGRVLRRPRVSWVADRGSVFQGRGGELCTPFSWKCVRGSLSLGYSQIISENDLLRTRVHHLRCAFPDLKVATFSRRAYEVCNLASFKRYVRLLFRSWLNWLMKHTNSSSSECTSTSSGSARSTATPTAPIGFSAARRIRCSCAAG